jgi:uncharacterized circularly permuted ATP-grasp superfamily protein
MAIALASLSLEGGYFDELHAAPAGSSAALAPAWKTFFDLLGGDGVAHLDRVAETVARQIRDNGVTYNLYADTRQPQRPWSLDLFPLLINAEDWREIEAGAIQRAQLLEAVMADVYGPQSLLAEAMLPPALVHGHPGYLRPMLKVAPVGGSYLHVAAFDLVRGPNGRWSVMSQRTQAPSGLGYLLENRLVISRHFSEAFETMGIQRLAATYRHWVESLKQHSTAGSHAHVALLTPGPYNETYFEHVYLARYLGVTLVEGGDLTVRDERLYLRTLRGLEPVHVLLKRLDDDFLDPLELRADSALGVPGLLQAIRAGHVVLANAPGSAFLESPALLGFLPALCKRLLNESLRLPALDTWWCGERAVLPSVLEQIGRTVIKPTYAGPARNPAFEPVLVSELSAGQRNQWLARIAGNPQHYALQFRTQASQIPTWVASQKGIVTRPVILRVFALRTSPDTWQVLPGGLARLVGSNAQVATMQRGGSSADVWVQAPSQQAVDRSTLLASSRGRPIAFTPRQRLVTSRAAENLFWFGRYTERCENSARLARLSLEALTGEDQASPSLLAWLQETTERSGLVPKGVPSVKPETRSSTRRRVFARTLIESLDQGEHVTSMGFNLRSIRRAASSVRERLATETWQMIDQAIERFSADPPRILGCPGDPVAR